MIYGAMHKDLVRQYKATYATLHNNYLYRIPSSAKAIAQHQRALLDLRLFLDSIGCPMPRIKKAKK